MRKIKKISGEAQCPEVLLVFCSFDEYGHESQGPWEGARSVLREGVQGWSGPEGDRMRWTSGPEQLLARGMTSCPELPVSIHGNVGSGDKWKERGAEEGTRRKQEHPRGASGGKEPRLLPVPRDREQCSLADAPPGLSDAQGSAFRSLTLIRFSDSFLICNPLVEIRRHLSVSWAPSRTSRALSSPDSIRLSRRRNTSLLFFKVL